MLRILYVPSNLRFEWHSKIKLYGINNRRGKFEAFQSSITVSLDSRLDAWAFRASYDKFPNLCRRPTKLTNWWGASDVSPCQQPHLTGFGPEFSALSQRFSAHQQPASESSYRWAFQILIFESCRRPSPITRASHAKSSSQT